ncbi:MAG: UDP-3-O-acyl-N-acetylglucosamine deacetylase [Parvularculaceae bacterium]|nr:UDP-3-O-acyl-N-acetylglucosamine deacetylase [Parvularculaceae bacterium]
MDDHLQHTLGVAATTAGVGLHSGLSVGMTLKPAPAGAGIVFRRIDLDKPLDATLIPARADFVAETRLGVVLRNKAGAEVATIEHLLAAFFLCGIDNAIVELDGPETPIFDGSAARYAEMIRSLGRVVQQAPRYALIVDRPYRVETSDRFVEIVPWSGRILDVAVDYPDPAIGARTISVSLDDPLDVGRILQARTFCALKDVEAMRQAGYGLGGSLENAVVVDDGRILNEGGLRDPEEFVLHKTLDIIGDLALIGAPMIGRVRARKSGHDLHTALARLILKDSLKVPKPDLSQVIF